MNHIKQRPWLWYPGLGAIAAVVLALSIVPAFADREDEEEDHEEIEQIEREHMEMEGFLMELESYERLLGVITQFRDISKDADAAGVAAVMGAEDHTDGPEELIEVLEKWEEDAGSKAVRRAIYIKLADAYGHTGDHDKALKYLEKLATND